MLTPEILASFSGTLLALLVAGIVWIIKSAYEIHKAEMLALAKYERIFALNISILRDNFDFLNEWIEALKINRPYSVHFENYFINDEDTYKIGNLKVINQIISLNYKLRRTSLDFDHISKSYWDMLLKIDAIQDESRKKANLETYHKNVLTALQKIRPNYDPLKNESVKLVALIRVAAKIRHHSLFGYLGLLFKDIFPKVTDKAIESEVETMAKNLERVEDTKQ